MIFYAYEDGKEMLKTVKKPLLPIFTPTAWQTVLLRLYGLVDEETLASVLKTTPKVIGQEAKRLGLEGISYQSVWQEKGYVTILRSVWNVLPYSQIYTLLQIDEAELAYRLKEDDFLGGKLGEKPECEEVVYEPLTEQERAKTDECAKIIRENFIKHYTPAFDFYTQSGGSPDNGGCDRIVYDYSSGYGDVFMEGDKISEEQLAALAAKGINGLWFQGVLSSLSPYPFKPILAEGYETRRENLNRLIDKCAKYGIKVYLYINEPRALLEHEFIGKYADCKGSRDESYRCLCTSHKAVQNYLFNAVYSLVEACPSLGGFITITMSENLTNCYSRGERSCPRCNKRKMEEVVSEVNNIIQAAVSQVGSKTRVIANLWAWTKGHGWSDEAIDRGIRLLDPKIEVMCVSELGTQIHGEKRKYVAEYSLSQIGPSEESKNMLSAAKRCGHKTWAKVQVNNSWEYASAPYIPAYELVIEHIQNLQKLQTGGYMLSWTLGGYPSKTLDLVNQMTKGSFDYDEWLKEGYGERAPAVKQAVHLFSEGFKKLPYDWTLLYNGPQHVGAVNLLYATPTGYKATMVGYPYDDLDSWKVGTEQEFLEGLGQMLDTWKQGLASLEQAGMHDGVEIYRYAKAFYLAYGATLNEASFILARREKDVAKMQAALNLEEELTKAQYALAAMDSRLGFEASNHYYYTQNAYLEKFINLQSVRKEIENDD